MTPIEETRLAVSIFIALFAFCIMMACAFILYTGKVMDLWEKAKARWAKLKL
jgi:hypothetical protein